MMLQKLLIIVGSLLGVAFAIQGEIESCKSWKLNRLPEVKRFLQTPGHADSYENLQITYIPHKSPLLYIKDDNGDFLEAIDLEPFTTIQLHELMAEKGFKRIADAAIPDL